MKNLQIDVTKWHFPTLKLFATGLILLLLMGCSVTEFINEEDTIDMNIELSPKNGSQLWGYEVISITYDPKRELSIKDIYITSEYGRQSLLTDDNPLYSKLGKYLISFCAMCMEVSEVSITVEFNGRMQRPVTQHYVINRIPIVRIEVEESDGLTFFNASSSEDPEGQELSFTWHYGDNTIEGPVFTIEDVTSIQKTPLVLKVSDGVTVTTENVSYPPELLTTPECYVDLDIDSNNNDDFNDPERSPGEDRIEAITNDPNYPGKLIPVNHGDWDLDLMPDYQDGYDPYADIIGDNIMTENPKGEHMYFHRIIVEIPKTVNLSNAQIRFNYKDVDPSVKYRTGNGTIKNPYKFNKPKGSMRIWKKNASKGRNSKEINTPEGNFVRSDVVYNALDFGEKHIITLYVEGINPSLKPGDQTIEIELFPDGVDLQSTVVCKDSVNVTLFYARFVNNFENEVKYSTGFSHPSPVVKTGKGDRHEDITVNDLKVISDTLVEVHFKGSVHSVIADLTEDRKADIKTVEIIYNHAKDTLKVPVRNVSQAKIQDITPYGKDPGKRVRPFEGRFDTIVKFRLHPGANQVIIRAENAIGRDGFDSFSIMTESEEGKLKITRVNNHKSTEEGLYNPIWIYIDDPSLVSKNSGRVTAEFFDYNFPVIYDGEKKRFRVDRPFIQLGKPFKDTSLVVHNIKNLLEKPEIAVLTYKGLKRNLAWSLTMASPANYYKYTPGTTVKHKFYSPIFKHIDIAGPEIKEKTNEKKEPYTFDAHCKADSVVSTLGIFERRVKIEIDSGAIKYPEKTIHWLLEDKTGKKFKAPVWHNAAFKVVPLKTIIVAVDGFGYESAKDAIGGLQAPNFKNVFEGAVQHTNPALAALPTITWANWPGIFSGLPPSQHGWTGNSYFPREKTDGGAYDNLRLPFVSSNTTGLGLDQKQSIGIVLGGPWWMPAAFSMADRTIDSKGSLYDKIGHIAINPDNELECRSLRMFYAYSENDNVNLEETFFSVCDPLGHSPEDAKTFDDGTVKLGKSVWDSEQDDIDVLTLYFPGPDNVAHHIGAMTGDPTGVPPVGWTTGNIRQTKHPLPSIAEQIYNFTDEAFGIHIIKQIEEDGYLNACLFVLIADHGLRAFRNTDEFNITSEDENGLEIQKLFDEPIANGGLDMKLWRNEGGVTFDDIEEYQAVFAPNGGMGQIYLRSENRTWQQPPLNDDIGRAAALLYKEATGQSSLYPELAPRTEKPVSDGAFGDPPAIFVRFGGTDGTDNANNNFMKDFRWVSGVLAAPPYITTGTIQDFFRARVNAGKPVNWPAFEARLQESNHKNPEGSRTGDIIFIMNEKDGHLAINQGDAYNGWHGGPTEAESYVPMMFNMPGPAIVVEDGKTNPGFVHEGFDTFVTNNLKPDGYLRSYQMADILVEIIKRVRSTDDPE